MSGIAVESMWQDTPTRVRRCVASDVDELQSFWGTGRECLRMESGAFRAEFSVTKLDRTMIRDERFSHGVVIHGVPFDDLWSLLVVLRADGRLDGWAIDAQEVVVIPPGECLSGRSRGAAHALRLDVEAATFQRLAETVYECDLDRVAKGTRTVTPPAPVLEQLRRLSGVPHDSAAKALARPALRRLLESDAIGSFFASVRAAPATRVPERSEPARRRRQFVQAIEYLREKSSEAVTIPEVCAAVGTSQRALEYSFRDYVDTTAVRYLKLHRLNAARRVLHAGYPSSTTVTEVALDLGFSDLSHFSVDYKALFGVSPSTTLRRA
jgi:AraC family ethanolamine operon transcriptional activator